MRTNDDRTCDWRSRFRRIADSPVSHSAKAVALFAVLPVLAISAALIEGYRASREVEAASSLSIGQREALLRGGDVLQRIVPDARYLAAELHGNQRIAWWHVEAQSVDRAPLAYLKLDARSGDITSVTAGHSSIGARLPRPLASAEAGRQASYLARSMGLTRQGSGWKQAGPAARREVGWQVEWKGAGVTLSVTVDRWNGDLVNAWFVRR